MNNKVLKDTIQQLFAGRKGLLEMDESTSTSDRRFAFYCIPQTVDMQCKYSELDFCHPSKKKAFSARQKRLFVSSERCCFSI